MQQAHLFEYAVVRVVPKVEREEFLNVGVIVYCRELSFLQVMYSLNEERLQIFCTQIDKQELLQNLQSVDRICKGSEDAGPIGNLDIAGRFRWLTATHMKPLPGCTHNWCYNFIFQIYLAWIYSATA